MYFLKDLITGTTALISANANGEEGNNQSFTPVFSPDGIKVAFASLGTNLVNNDVNNKVDVFIKDLQTGSISLASTNSLGEQGDSSSGNPIFSLGSGLIN